LLTVFSATGTATDEEGYGAVGFGGTFFIVSPFIESVLKEKGLLVRLEQVFYPQRV